MTNGDQDELPHISVNAQYTKDLSFENPGAPDNLVRRESPPEIGLSLDVIIKPMPEEGCFEVTLHIDVEAKYKDIIIFIIELQYAGIFTLMNIPQNQQEAVLSIHCASMIFPFARQILADVTQNGGFQPLMIDPIDFGRLFEQRTKA